MPPNENSRTVGTNTPNRSLPGGLFTIIPRKPQLINEITVYQEIHKRAQEAIDAKTPPTPILDTESAEDSPGPIFLDSSNSENQRITLFYKRFPDLLPSHEAIQLLPNLFSNTPLSGQGIIDSNLDGAWTHNYSFQRLSQIEKAKAIYHHALENPELNHADNEALQQRMLETYEKIRRASAFMKEIDKRVIIAFRSLILHPDILQEEHKSPKTAVKIELRDQYQSLKNHYEQQVILAISEKTNDAAIKTILVEFAEKTHQAVQKIKTENQETIRPHRYVPALPILFLCSVSYWLLIGIATPLRFLGDWKNGNSIDPCKYIPVVGIFYKNNNFMKAETEANINRADTRLSQFITQEKPDQTLPSPV